MNKKRWALVILLVGLLLGYFKLFYKTWSNDTVAKNADCIVAVDVKRITNTLIWNFISTPSQWKTGSIFPSSGNKLNWDDMVKLPDYVFIFHAANQPLNAWYTVLQIKDIDDFNKGLEQFHFQKQGNNEYISRLLGLVIILGGDQLLMGSAAVQDKQFIHQVANELFTKNQYAARERIQKNIDAASHLAVQVEPDLFLQETAIIKGNFDKSAINIETLLSPKTSYGFTESNFSFNDSSLCTILLTQPPPALYNLMPDSARAGISKAIGFNIDSLLLPGNSTYQLDIEGVYERMDSAISYRYDDNFNPVENTIVNNVQEPAFDFTVKGNGIPEIYTYWNNNGKLERTDGGELFTAMPLVKSYCYKKNSRELSVTSNNYKTLRPNNTGNYIFLVNLLLTKIPASLINFLPANFSKTISNLESVQVTAKKEQGQVLIRTTINKKKNDLPFIVW